MFNVHKLIAAALVSSLSFGAVAQTVNSSRAAANNAPVAAQPSPQSQSHRSVAQNNNGTAALAGLAILGLLIYAATNSGDSSSSSNTRDYYRYQNQGSSPNSGSSRPDTSVGCAWGDRAYGTCH